MPGTTPPPVLDRRQLECIQSVHRGFLYQHLYAAACLLRAGGAATTTVRVETDEDVEVVGPTRWQRAAELDALLPAILDKAFKGGFIGS